MKCSIKPIKLRTLPWPATKPVYDNQFYILGEQGGVLPYKIGPLSNVADMDRAKTEQSVRNSHAKQKSIASRKHERVVKMAIDGWSDKDIGEAVGYTPRYVQELLKDLRKSGVDIPERKRGRKKKKCKD